MKLVLDENLSIPRLQAALQSRDIPLVLQTELMPRGLPDEDVLAALRNHTDLYLLSRDQDFRYKHRRPFVAKVLGNGKVELCE